MDTLIFISCLALNVVVWWHGYHYGYADAISKMRKARIKRR